MMTINKDPPMTVVQTIAVIFELEVGFDIAGNVLFEHILFIKQDVSHRIPKYNHMNQ